MTPPGGDPTVLPSKPEADSGSGWRFARALLLGLLFAPVCCYWAQDQGVDRIFSLMVPPVALTLFLVILNAPLRRFLPRFALGESELIVFYAMQSVLCAMASEWMDVVAPTIYSFAAFSDTTPRYERYVLPYVSDWLFFKDAAPLRNFIAGGKPFALFLAELPVWWPKIIAWTVLVSLISIAMLCINALMREHWIHREKLSFPIVQLPVAITQNGGGGPFWKSRWMWAGFAATFLIDMLNGFAFLYPSIPLINIRFLGDMNTWFSSPPWNQTGWTPIGLFPFISALGFFVPTDLLFSLLFFFFARKAQQLIAFEMGHQQGVFGGGGLVPAAPYFSEQSWGAFLGLFVSAMWLARPHLKAVWAEVVDGVPGGVDGRRAGYRAAFLGLIACIGLLCVVGVGIGVPVGVVLFYALVFLAFSVTLTRLRAQLGAPTHEMAFMGPNQLLVDIRGTAGLPPDLTARTVTAFHIMNRIHRTHPMPSMLEGMYLAERSPMLSQRGMFVALLIATIAGSILGHLIRVWLGYRYTPGNGGGETAGVIATLVDTPRPPNPSAIFAIVAGFAVVLGLDILRLRVPGFWLHPGGYALAMNFGVDYYWFGLLIVLIVKVFVQRYYGLGGYEKLRLIALGLILGEFAAEAIWGTFSMLNERMATYTISINGKMGWDK